MTDLRPLASLASLASLAAIVDRARMRIAVAELPRLVMSDPGYPGYIAAYTRVLAEGTPALLADGGRMLTSFDITENLLLAHAEAARSPAHRWFSILAACIELMGWDGYATARGGRASSALCHLLADSVALADAGDADALSLVGALCREAQAVLADRHLRALAMIGELLALRGVDVATDAAADAAADAAIDAACRELAAYHDACQPAYVEADGTGEWIPNPWAARNPAFVWGAAVHERTELRRWLALVEARFPTTTATARATRERLLCAGDTRGR